MDKIALRTHAKINIGLDINFKRNDGYHDITTLMHSVGIYDELFFEKNGETVITGDCPRLSCDETNIVYKCIKLMREASGVSASMNVHIKKFIPMQAGLGGGSADGAATLYAFNKLYGLNLSMQRLAEIGARAGADIPFSLYGGFCLCEGIGDKITPVNGVLSYHCLIIKPPHNADTPGSYSRYDEIIQSGVKVNKNDFTSVVFSLQNGYTTPFKESVTNAFEYCAADCENRISEIKASLLGEGAFLASMSGSGSALYGLFESERDVKRASEALWHKYGASYMTRLVNGSVEEIR